MTLGVLAGCTSAPPLPVPPPAVEALSTPDPDGVVTASGIGRPNAFIACVNVDSDAGVIVRANEDGAWSLEIPAIAGDSLLFFQLLDDGRGAPVERIVPGPRAPDGGP